MIILLISLSVTQAAVAAERSKAHYIAGGLIIDVTSLGIEKWDAVVFGKITSFRQKPLAFSVRLVLPAFSGGMDIALGNRILFASGINVLIRSRDTDTEVLIGLGLRY